MDCGHQTYQCTAPILAQGPKGEGSILVCMWCTTCGACALRVPQVAPADQRSAALRAPAALPKRAVHR